MRSMLALRAPGVAGVLAGVLIFASMYITTLGIPAPEADAAEWAAWARREEGTLETGVYLLLVPGLALFLWMFSALAAVPQRYDQWARLAQYGALGFAILLAAGGVLQSTTASTFGFFPAFEDPTAITAFMGWTAGYHLQAVGIWSLALTMAATGIGLLSSGQTSMGLAAASIVAAALAVAASFIGLGIVFGLVWMVAVGLALLWRNTVADAPVQRPA
jgi:hypothetical protein